MLAKKMLPFIFISLFLFLPFVSVEPYTIACECEQITPEMPSVFVVPHRHYMPSERPSFAQPRQNVQEKVVRAAIDIGSGATKLRVAEVNLKTHKIEKILVNESFPVQYQEHLSKSPSSTFDEDLMKTGIDAIKKSKEIAMQHQAQKVIAVATASFRKAVNSQDFINRIYHETGVRVYVIDQELEGKLAFNAVLSQGNYDPSKLIVWDIGGGSLQLTAKDDGDYLISRGNIASIDFKNMVIGDIQKQDINKVSTPNPLLVSEIIKGIIKAREIAQSVDPIFKERIIQPESQIVGVGNIFAYGIYPAVGKKSPYTQQDLYKATLSMADKDDKQLGGGDYANVQVTNAIFVLGYMQALGINNVYVLDINNADGALLYDEFWL